MEVVAADTGEDITVKILSRALRPGVRPSSPRPTPDPAASRGQRGGRNRRRSGRARRRDPRGGATPPGLRPESLGRTLAPLTRRLEDARARTSRGSSGASSERGADLGGGGAPARGRPRLPREPRRRPQQRPRHRKPAVSGHPARPRKGDRGSQDTPRPARVPREECFPSQIRGDLPCAAPRRRARNHPGNTRHKKRRTV